MTENRILPNKKIYLDSVNLYIGGLGYSVLHIADKQNLFINNETLIVNESNSVFQGIPTKSGKFITTNEEISRYSLGKNYLSLENKIQNYDELFSTEYRIQQLIGEDADKNLYVIISNESLLLNKHIDYREIGKFNVMGSKDIIIKNLPDNLSESVIDDIAIDKNGVIYYLYVQEQKASLMKWVIK